MRAGSKPAHAEAGQMRAGSKPARAEAEQTRASSERTRAEAEPGQLSEAASDPRRPIQRVVYIDQHNASKVPAIKANKLATKETLGNLLGKKLGVKDRRNEYLFENDPRIPHVANLLADFIAGNYNLETDIGEIRRFAQEWLELHANPASEEYALNVILSDLAKQLSDNDLISEKARPSLGMDEGEKYSGFIGKSHERLGETPNGVNFSNKTDFLNSFTSQGQQVNLMAFMNKTPIGAFHNKHRDKTVVSTLKTEGFSVPRHDEHVHSHAEDEAIYEMLFGNLKDMVQLELEGEGTPTITFMISDLTCNHNQITSSEQRRVRSCAENIVKFAQILRQKNEDVQVQVIYARPYGLNYFSHEGHAYQVLGQWAKNALDLFHDNGIRARAISNFFTPEQRDSDVLALPETYGIEEPGSPLGFDASDTPFPNLGTSEEEEMEGFDPMGGFNPDHETGTEDQGIGEEDQEIEMEMEEISGEILHESVLTEARKLGVTEYFDIGYVDGTDDNCLILSVFAAAGAELSASEGKACRKHLAEEYGIDPAGYLTFTPDLGTVLLNLVTERTGVDYTLYAIQQAGENDYAVVPVAGSGGSTALFVFFHGVHFNPAWSK